MTALTTHGTRFDSFTDAYDRLDTLDHGDLGVLLTRLGRAMPTDPTAALYAARQAVSQEFDDTFLSARTHFGPGPTLFDREPTALAIIQRLIDKVESLTNGPYPVSQIGAGYAPDGEAMQCREHMVWAAKAIALRAADMPTTASLWLLAKAMTETNAPYWAEGMDDAGYLLGEALKDHRIADPGQDALRFVPWKVGFLTLDEFDTYHAARENEKIAIRVALNTYANLSLPRSSFNYDKAREAYSLTRSAKYFDPDIAAQVHFHKTGEALSAEAYNVKKYGEAYKATPAARELEANDLTRPITGGNRDKLAAFGEQELRSGFSPYGYWFSPDGQVFPMPNPQCHVYWMSAHLGDIRDDDGHRIRADDRAYALGWVAMTMWDEWKTDAAVSYRPDAPNALALKAAQKIVRRGGDFPGVMIEAYDADHEVLSYRQFRDEFRPQTGYREAAVYLGKLAEEAYTPEDYDTPRFGR
jgi:hypothetical protein